MLTGVCSGQFSVQRSIQELGEIDLSHGHLNSATGVTLIKAALHFVVQIPGSLVLLMLVYDLLGHPNDTLLVTPVFFLPS